MTWFDNNDARLLAKVAAGIVAFGVVVVSVAGIFGLALRVFGVMAG